MNTDMLRAAIRRAQFAPAASPPVPVRPTPLPRPPVAPKPIPAPPVAVRPPLFTFVLDEPKIRLEPIIWKHTYSRRVRRMVANFYRVTLAEIEGQNRTQRCSRPRFTAMYLCVRHGGMSVTTVGRLFAGRDHSTVIHAVKMVTDRMAEDARYAAEIADFIEQIEAWS